MFIDFWRSPHSHLPSTVCDLKMSQWQQDKFLGSVLRERFKFDANTAAVCEKAVISFKEVVTFLWGHDTDDNVLFFSCK